MAVTALFAPENRGTEGVARPLPGPVRDFYQNLEHHGHQQDLVNKVARTLSVDAAKRIALKLAAAQMAAYPQFDDKWDPDKWDLWLTTAEEPRRKGGISFVPGDYVLHEARSSWGPFGVEHFCWSMRRSVSCLVHPGYFVNAADHETLTAAGAW